MSWVEVDGAGWSLVELGARFSNTHYGLRHIKLCKIQNQLFAGVLQDRFFKEFC